MQEIVFHHRIDAVFDFDAGDFPDDLIPAAFKWAEAARKPVILALEKRLGAEAAA